MKEGEKRVSLVFSLFTILLSLLLTSVYSVHCLVYCCTGVGWKCLDFDIFLEDRQSGLPPLQRFHTAVLKVHYPRHFS